jgi:hypothetical protein
MLVDTASRRTREGEFRSVSLELQLSPVDSNTAVSELHRGRTRLQLRGSVEGQPAELDDGAIYFGWRNAFHGLTHILQPNRISSSGFRGKWRDAEYYTITEIDEVTGFRYPRPAGYFCATRVR